MIDEPLQFSVTRIGPDVFRLVVQSDKRTLYTGNIERKNIAAAIEAELARLKVLPFNGV